MGVRTSKLVDSYTWSLESGFGKEQKKKGSYRNNLLYVRGIVQIQKCNGKELNFAGSWPLLSVTTSRMCGSENF